VVEPAFCDAGLSGTLPIAERPALVVLVEAAQASKIDAVIVAELDRIGRKTSLVLSIIKGLAQAGSVIVSCNESLDTSTPAGNFVLTMFAALAQLERDTIVARTTAGRNERGKHMLFGSFWSMCSSEPRNTAPPSLRFGPPSKGCNDVEG
jgi:site-specific DNA recombinase